MPGEFDVPSAEESRQAHTNADTDGSLAAAHHTLGPRKEQAAAGNHAHNGGDSIQLLGDFSITGSKTSGAALNSVIAALKELGATDATSP